MEIGDWIILLVILFGLFYIKVYHPNLFTPIDKAATTGAQTLFNWFDENVIHKNTNTIPVNNVSTTGGG